MKRFGFLDKAVEYLKEAGAKRLVPLKVSGPFHTALLKPASDKLAKELEAVTFEDFKLPLIGNTKARVMEKSEIKTLLARQVMEPVRFYESIDTMVSLGMTNVIEIGPGKVLAGFLKKIDKTIPSVSVYDKASLEELLAR